MSILSTLLRKTEYALTKVRRIFPDNCPKDDLPALIALFKLSVESSRKLEAEFPMMCTGWYQNGVLPSHLAGRGLCDILASFLTVLCRDNRIYPINYFVLQLNFSVNLESGRLFVVGAR